MQIQSIENVQPLLVETDNNSEAYVTHAVFTDFEDAPFALITIYSPDQIEVFPSRFDEETNLFESIPDEVAALIATYLESNPLQVLDYKQLKEVLHHEQ